MVQTQWEVTQNTRWIFSPICLSVNSLWHLKMLIKDLALHVDFSCSCHSKTEKDKGDTHISNELHLCFCCSNLYFLKSPCLSSSLKVKLLLFLHCVMHSWILWTCQSGLERWMRSTRAGCWFQRRMLCASSQMWVQAEMLFWPWSAIFKYRLNIVENSPICCWTCANTLVCARHNSPAIVAPRPPCSPVPAQACVDWSDWINEARSSLLLCG